MNIREAIATAVQHYDAPAWRKWAEGWLDGTDTSVDTARKTLTATVLSANEFIRLDYPKQVGYRMALGCLLAASEYNSEQKEKYIEKVTSLSDYLRAFMQRLNK